MLACRYVGLLLLCVMLAMSGCAAGSLAASDAFSYACAAGGECAVYLTLTNPTRESNALLGARSDVAARTELHKLVIDGQGDLQMQQVANVPLPAAGAVELKPGATHIMLYELNQELRAGDTFTLTLSYANGGEETVQVVVLPKN